MSTHSPLFPVAVITIIIFAAPARAESARAWNLRPEQGFIDDFMAFDKAERRFAYIHTDSSQFLKIVVLSTSDFKQVAEIKVDDPSAIPKGLAFTQDGSRLVLIWMDGYKGTRSAMLFDVARKKLIKKVGPANHVELASFKGQQAVTLTKETNDRAGGNRFSVTAYRSSDFRRIGGGAVYIGPDLMLKRPPIRVLYWEPGHVSLVGMQKGKYDRKRDIRLPDRGVRYNVLLRKTTWSEEPKEVVKWTHATNMRPNHPGQLRFLEVSDDLKSIHYVDENNGLFSVKTPVKWTLYEPKSLVQRESWDQTRLYFSFTIDPVNPDAVRRKKADRERMDLYRLDPGPKATPLGQVYTKRRKFIWTAGRRFFSYLYKLKGFGRGGREVAVYRVR